MSEPDSGFVIILLTSTKPIVEVLRERKVLKEIDVWTNRSTKLTAKSQTRLEYFWYVPYKRADFLLLHISEQHISITDRGNWVYSSKRSYFSLVFLRIFLYPVGFNRLRFALRYFVIKNPPFLDKWPSVSDFSHRIQIMREILRPISQGISWKFAKKTVHRIAGAYAYMY